jgi:hypothetical protein
MSRIWNGKDLDKEVPELGLRLDFASLVPEFAVQLLESGLCTGTERTLITPLDDLKAWLRTQNPGEAGLLHDVRELLLAQEEKDRAKAAAEGIRFDLVDYELQQMNADESYEQFNPEWARNILALAVEEADALQAFNLAELKSEFSLSMSFSLPKAKGKGPEPSGMLLLEFSARGAKLPPKPRGSTAFVRVEINDRRAGDATDAHLSLAYPLELEARFLAAFDALRKQLTLKDEE